jgi:hypothetical protein
MAGPLFFKLAVMLGGCSAICGCGCSPLLLPVTRACHGAWGGITWQTLHCTDNITASHSRRTAVHRIVVVQDLCNKLRDKMAANNGHGNGTQFQYDGSDVSITLFVPGSRIAARIAAC